MGRISILFVHKQCCNFEESLESMCVLKLVAVVGVKFYFFSFFLMLGVQTPAHPISRSKDA